MKIQVLHDKKGKICAIFAPTDGKRKGGIEAPSRAMTVIEVDAPDITPSSHADQSDQGDGVAAKLNNLMEQYEVRSGRLVKRSGKSKGSRR
jgi:hypothetical protein